jgi:hypothetical protein
MTREQAQEILMLQRPGRADENDPEMVEAMRLAATDPELKQWLQQQREFNASVSSQFRSIEPPSDLKARILAGAKQPEKPVSFFHKRHVLALAASIILLFAATSLFLMQDREDAPTFANFRSRMTSFALKTYQMGVVTNNPAVVRQYLARHGAPADFPLTPALEKLPVKGGGRLSWQNQPVAMICFSLTNNQTAFMFVMDEHAMKKQPKPFELSSKKNFTSVAWTREGKVYLLAAAERPELLASLASQ